MPSKAPSRPTPQPTESMPLGDLASLNSPIGAERFFTSTSPDVLASSAKVENAGASEATKSVNVPCSGAEQDGLALANPQDQPLPKLPAKRPRGRPRKQQESISTASAPSTKRPRLKRGATSPPPDLSQEQKQSYQQDQLQENLSTKHSKSAERSFEEFVQTNLPTPNAAAELWANTKLQIDAFLKHQAEKQKYAEDELQKERTARAEEVAASRAQQAFTTEALNRERLRCKTLEEHISQTQAEVARLGDENQSLLDKYQQSESEAEKLASALQHIGEKYATLVALVNDMGPCLKPFTSSSASNPYGCHYPVL